MKKRLIVSLVAVIFILLIYRFIPTDPELNSRYVDFSRLLSDTGSVFQFERAELPRKLAFRDDMGAHRQFQTEWWYFTGNLQDGSGRPFGYQLTFFRRALGKNGKKGQSEWRADQIYMAHFAVSDIQSGRFMSFERFARESLGLAGAEVDPFRVWLENWRVYELGDKRWRLEAEAVDARLSIDLNPMKEMILNGQDGLSRKGPEVGAASYYFSITRLGSNGTLCSMDGCYDVTGFSWLDREWSTSVLSRNQVGWDWFALQLDDMREIMLFQIRETGGGISPFSSGSLVDEQGRKTHLTSTQVSITVLDDWQSPKSGKKYPSKWRIRIPHEGLELLLQPLMKDQEHRHSFAYWEGAVGVSGSGVTGRGYVELTGY